MRSFLALTSPASWMAPPNSSSFSVSVVLPASGCEMIAKVRRRETGEVSLAWVGLAVGRATCVELCGPDEPGQRPGTDGPGVLRTCRRHAVAPHNGFTVNKSKGGDPVSHCHQPQSPAVATWISPLRRFAPSKRALGSRTDADRQWKGRPARGGLSSWASLQRRGGSRSVPVSAGSGRGPGLRRPAARRAPDPPTWARSGRADRDRRRLLGGFGPQLRPRLGARQPVRLVLVEDHVGMRRRQHPLRGPQQGLPGLALDLASAARIDAAPVEEGRPQRAVALSAHRDRVRHRAAGRCPGRLRSARPGRATCTCPARRRRGSI